MKRLLLTLLAMPTLAFAQADRKFVRFIPLGELPVWDEELVDGIRVQKPIQAGDMPPSTISAPAGDDNIQQQDISLGRASSKMTFGPNVGTLTLFEGKNGAGKQFLTSPMPTATHSLGVLFRDNANMTWLQPKMLMLKDDKDTFPANHVRFVNVSDLRALVKIGGKAAEVIKPGDSLLKPIKPGENPIVVGYYNKEGVIQMIFQNSIRLIEGQRVQGFLYKGQGKEPRSEVKFISFPEPLPRP